MPARSSRVLGVTRTIKTQPSKGRLIEAATFNFLQKNPSLVPPKGCGMDFGADVIMPQVGTIVWNSLKHPMNSVYKATREFNANKKVHRSPHNARIEQLECDLLTEQKNVCYWQRECSILSNRLHLVGAIANLR